MGLDQYCFAFLRDDCTEGDDGYLVPKPEDQRKGELEEVGYWRRATMAVWRCNTER
jgi:hypothetical protein